MKIRVDEEFRDRIPPLRPEEKQQLETSLKRDGCLIPLVIWGHEGILLDGYHRFEICQRLNIPFETTPIDVPDREAAADWIDANQLGRRNLTQHQFSMILGRLYNRAKKQHGGNRQASGQNAHLTGATGKTAKRLAKHHGVDERTVRRAGKYAEAVEKLKVLDPEIEKKVAKGTSPPKKAVVQAAKLLPQNPGQAKAVLEGRIPEPEQENLVAESPTAHADTVIARAIEAAEAVLQLGDLLLSVRAELYADFLHVYGQLGKYSKQFRPRVSRTTVSGSGNRMEASANAATIGAA